MTEATKQAIAAAVAAAIEATQPAPEPVRDMFTIREVCDRLRVTRPTLYRLAQRGALRMVKIGRSVRIQAADVAALIAGKSAA